MKYLMDNIHGSISVNDNEVDVMDHMLFQRLRHIRQNDILYLTFMGATHTRFSHSLGVMHMGSKLFDMLLPIEMQARESRFLSSCIYLKRILRMALMLHDTGHSAFSHLLESIPALHKEVYSKPIHEVLWREVGSSRIMETATKHKPERLYHEHYSIRIAYEIMSDIAVSEDEIWDTLSLMEGFPSDEMSEDFIEASVTVMDMLSGNVMGGSVASANIRKILHFIVSSEIDADKLDYLRRDSFHAGVGYGSHDVEGLINSLKLVFDKGSNEAVVTVSEPGLASVCDLIDARYKLYAHINNHIGNNGSEVIFEKAINEVLAEESMKNKIVDRMTDMKGFCFFTDDMIMSMISDVAMASPNSYCSLFLKRKRATHLATFRSHQDAAIESSIQDIVDSHESGRVSVSSKWIKFSQIDDQYRDLMVRIKRSDDKLELKKLTDVTNFFESRESFMQYSCYLA